jgi:hypothetical protein
VGFSFGGGGTGATSCRNGRCAFEHDGGVAANNIIAHCNDFGVDINRSKGITIVHNTLINTAGIDVRNAPASASISNNVLEGRIRQRDGGWFLETNNLVTSATDLFKDADNLDLEFSKAPEEVPVVAAAVQDLCGLQRTQMALPGALSKNATCLKPSH